MKDLGLTVSEPGGSRMRVVPTSGKKIWPGEERDREDRDRAWLVGRA